MTFQIILQFIIFISATLITFFLPGYLMVSFFKLKAKSVNLLLSFVFGIVMLALQGYTFGYLNIRWFTYVYLAVVLVFLLIKKRNLLIKIFSISPKKIVKENKITALLIFIGIIVQLIPVAGSGLNLGKGMIFFGNNAYDGLTHLGFIQSLINHFPPIEPGAYHFPLQNYHYLSDLVIAEFSRVWKIPINLLLFQFFPLLVSFLTGVAAYLSVRNFGGSKGMANWMVFLMYFAGGGTYIIMLILHGVLNFNTPEIDNGAMQFLNMSNAMAKMIFLASLIPLQQFIISNKKSWGLFTVFFLAPLIGFKVYFGIFAIIGFSFVIAAKLIMRFIVNNNGSLPTRITNVVKKNFFNLILLLTFALIACAIYLPVNGNAGGLFYAPLEWPKSLLGPGSINWEDWWLRMQVYIEHKNYRNIYIMDAIAVIITLISVYGTRILGFFLSLKLLKFLGWEKALFFIPGLLIFNFLGLFTLQKAGGLNVFNFFVVSAVILSLFSAFILSQLSGSKKLAVKIFLIIFILLSIPRTIYEDIYSINNYQAKTDSYTISNDELTAMDYIDKNLPKDIIVQASPKNEKDYQVGYLSTFSKRKTYLAATVFLEIRNRDVNDEEISLKKMFDANSASEFVTLAKEKNIQYVYLLRIPDQELRFKIDSSLLRMVYENRQVSIFKVI